MKCVVSSQNILKKRKKLREFIVVDIIKTVTLK